MVTCVHIQFFSEDNNLAKICNIYVSIHFLYLFIKTHVGTSLFQLAFGERPGLSGTGRQSFSVLNIYNVLYILN